MQLQKGKCINAEMELKVKHSHKLLNEELDDVSGFLNTTIILRWLMTI